MKETSLNFSQDPSRWLWALLEPLLLFYWLFIVIEAWIPGFVKSYFPLDGLKNVMLVVAVLWVIKPLVPRRLKAFSNPLLKKESV